MKNKSLNIISKIFRTIVAFFAILLVLSVLSKFINPQTFMPMSILSLVFPYLLVINGIFAIIYIFKLKIFCLVPILAIATSYNDISNFVRFNKSVFDENEQKLNILSYNVDIFNHFETEQSETKVLSIVEEELPEIVCFQEYYENIKNKKIQKQIANFNNLKYHSISRSNKNILFGNIIFSKFPIINDSLITFQHSKNCIVFADIVAYGDTFRIINFHLASTGFKENDAKFINEIGLLSINRNDLRKGLFSVLKKISVATNSRVNQTNILTTIIAKSPYSCVVCGDLNDTPYSFCYREITKNGTLKDAFGERGVGFGKTYNGHYPSYRIDYIFYSEDFYCESFSILNEKYSDHYPILTKLKVCKVQS
ncbi:endonuclease [Bacteroidia bacterium]|nr:endonuclease [Bacteroidia bacterium]